MMDGLAERVHDAADATGSRREEVGIGAREVALECRGVATAQPFVETQDSAMSKNSKRSRVTPERPVAADGEWRGR